MRCVALFAVSWLLAVGVGLFVVWCWCALLAVCRSPIAVGWSLLSVVVRLRLLFAALASLLALRCLLCLFVVGWLLALCGVAGCSVLSVGMCCSVLPVGMCCSVLPVCCVFATVCC